MIYLLTTLHVLFCLFLILVILLQTGKGGGMGVAFGGSGGSVFGPRGAGSFIGKLTGVVAFLFMLSSILLAYMSSSQTTGLEKQAALMTVDAEGEEVDLLKETAPSDDAEPIAGDTEMADESDSATTTDNADDTDDTDGIDDTEGGDSETIAVPDDSPSPAQPVVPDRQTPTSPSPASVPAARRTTADTAAEPPASDDKSEPTEKPVPKASPAAEPVPPSAPAIPSAPAPSESGTPQPQVE